MSQRELSIEELDHWADKFLRASGSALKHYSMQKSKDDMRQVLREFAASLSTEPNNAAA